MTKTLETKNYIVEIAVDEDPLNPRENNCNFGTIVYGHRRYILGDEEAWNTDSYGNWDEWLEGELGENVVALPVYLYDHSLQSLSTESFVGRAPHAEWDSGQAGWIYVTHEDIIREYGELDKEKATKVLEAEVEEFNRYIQGEICWVEVAKKDICPECYTTRIVCIDSLYDIHHDDVEEIIKAELGAYLPEDELQALLEQI